MSEFDFDLFVIGAGSGGVRASRMAAQLGAKVAVAEDTFLGGTCVNVGCVPKKLFVYGSHFAEEFHAARGFGWQSDAPVFDWPTLRDNKTREIERLNGVYGNILSNAGVELIEGRASLTGPNSLVVGDKSYTAARILIATGGEAVVPQLPGSEHIINSNDAFYLEELPDKIVIVGGGYIAVEFAGIFNGLGVETHLLYRGPLFLRGFDEDVREFTAAELRKKGINLHFDCNIESIERLASGQLSAQLTDGSQLEAGQIMYATGRRPRIEGLGLEHTAVATAANGAIQVNDQFQTAEPSVYAVGDVIDRVQLTPVALAEGMALVRHLYGNQPINLDYSNIASAVFCQPNIATVGLTEQQAQEQGFEVSVFKSQFRHMKHTLSGVDEQTLMKLVVDKASDRVLGCHMVGSDAGEIIQGLAVAMRAGATKADFDQTIGIHPTAAEEFVTMREPVA